QVYKRRWYVLVMFSFFAASQNLIWNTWGPIADSAKEAFGWSNADIGLLTNWGPISYLISGVFFSWMIDVKGLRVACVVSCFLGMAGAGLRCFYYICRLIHIGQFLNGLGGPVAMAGSPVISATWFPPEQRTTSTSIGVIIPYILGLAGSFLIGPYLVPSHSKNNNTLINLVYVDNHVLISQIFFFSFLEFAVAGLIFLIMLIYFPKKPPLPPCLSASISRQDFWTGLKALFRCKQFWLVAIAYGSSLGVCNVWTGVIQVVLKPLGISQSESGWIGFYATAAACVASLVIGRFADIFAKHLKIFIISLYAVGSVFIIWFALACIKIGPYSAGKAVLYTTTIMGVMSLNAATPLLYELGCELAYPIGEGTVNGMMTIMNNLAGLIFLFILMIPNIGTIWMNWALLAATVICFPLYGFLKDTYNRLDLDTTVSKQTHTS
ncbi:hypothetical protein LOTGIDRAFT_133974, partial [Lottia gigantea]